MNKRLNSFTYVVPLLELSFGAATVLAPAFLFFIRLKQMAHGTGSVSLSLGEIEMRIPSDRFLWFAFDRAGWWAENPLTILNAPAKFVEIFVSLLVAQKPKWYPASLLSYTWHALIYPIYALPAWFTSESELTQGWDAVSFVHGMRCSACFSLWPLPFCSADYDSVSQWRSAKFKNPGIGSATVLLFGAAICDSFCGMDAAEKAADSPTQRRSHSIVVTETSPQHSMLSGEGFLVQSPGFRSCGSWRI